MSNINAIKIAEKAIVVSCRLWTHPCRLYACRSQYRISWI